MTAESCGCCAGVTASTPRLVEHRHGLPSFGYRVGVHGDFLASLAASLTDEDLPALARLRSRDPRDVTMALLDGVATMCDVLTFYTERLAQESYLRTAVDRTSLRELGRLVAYRLRAGVASQTHLAFFIQPPPATPAGGDGFAAAPYLAGGVDLPAGLPVRSVPGPGEQPQTFETSEAVNARPEWNALRAWQTKPTTLGVGGGATAVHLAGTGHRLRPGDALLFAGAPGTSTAAWALRTVTAVTEDPAAGRTRLSWAPGVAAADLPANPRIFAMRKRLSVFGHNAPARQLVEPDSTGEWPFNISPTNYAVDVDGSHPDILSGTWLVMRYGTFLGLGTVSSVEEVSRAEYGLTGKVTRCVFGVPTDVHNTNLRNITVLAVAEELPVTEEPDLSAVGGGTVVVAGKPSLPDGRTVLVAGHTVAGQSTAELAVVVGSSFSGGKTTLTLDGNLTKFYHRSTVTVYGNVAAATHGETVYQILGSGEGSRAHQRFQLAHAPLTHVASDVPAGASSTLKVRVNDVEWYERPTLHDAEPGDRSFVTRESDSGTVLVAFGDGDRGARLPTGVNNVRAEYRRGIGTGGNVPTGAISQVMDPPLGLTKVTNPLPAVGGADPETVTAARGAIALPVRTLGRAVSLLDYADYARAFAGIAKADATVLALPGGRTIVVTVAAGDGVAVPEDTRSRLVASLRTYGDPLVPVLVLPYRPARFRVAMRVRRSPDREFAAVESAVRAELARAFSFEARDFGQPVHRSEVVAAVHRVPGVVAVDLDKLYRVAPPVPPEPGWPPAAILAARLLAARPRVTANRTPLAAELLMLASTNPFESLEEMS